MTRASLGMRELIAFVIAFCLAIGTTPSPASFAWAESIAFDTGGELRASLSATSDAEVTVNATFVNTEARLWLEYTADEVTGKYGHGEVFILETNPAEDEQGVKYWFVTNPDKDKRDEVQLVWVDWHYDATKKIDLVIPGHVIAGGHIYEVTEIGPITQALDERGETGNAEHPNLDELCLTYYYKPIDEWVPAWYENENSWTRGSAKKSLAYAMEHPLLHYVGDNNFDLSGYGASGYWIPNDSEQGYTKESTTGVPVTMCASVSIPSTVKSINGQCFRDWNFERVTLAEGLERISDGAFHGCNKLKELTLPSTLEAIGGVNYYRHDAKDHATNKAYEDRYGEASKYGLYVTKSNQYLTDIGADEITGEKVIDPSHAGGVGFISGCSSLKRLSYPDSCAIYSSLTNFLDSTLSSLQRISVKGAATGVLKFKYLNGAELIEESFEYSDGDNVITSTKGGTRRLAYIFPGIETLVVPDTVATVQNEREESLMSDKKITAKSISLGSGIKEFYAGTFTNNPYVEEVWLSPECVSVIGNYADTPLFKNCSNLRTVHLGGLSWLPSQCFSGCTSLQNIVFDCPGEKITFEVGALTNDNKLASLDSVNVYLPDSVKTFEVKEGRLVDSETTKTVGSAKTVTRNSYSEGCNVANPFFRKYNLTKHEEKTYTKKTGIHTAGSSYNGYPKDTITEYIYPSLAKTWKVYGSERACAQFAAMEAVDDALKSSYISLTGNQGKIEISSYGALRSFNPKTVTASITTNGGYSGTPKLLHVLLQGATDVSLEDYEVLADNLVDAGTRSATIIGKNAYFGSKIENVPFTIEPANLNDVSATATIPEQAYTGKSVEPVPEVSTVLVEGGDSTKLTSDDFDVLSYSDNVLPGETAKVTVEGKGNFTGTKEFTFTIASNELYETDAAAAKAVDDQIEAIGTVRYTSASNTAISDAEKAYGELSDVQKLISAKHDDLVAARAEYENQKAAAEAEAEREAAARSARAAREAAERAAQEAAEKEAAEKAAQEAAEKAEREAAEAAAREAAERAAREEAEKAAREEAERQAAEEAARAASTGDGVKAVAEGGTEVTADVSDAGTATLTKVDSATGSVTVDTITTADGTQVPVTEIAAGAFAGTEVESVTVGESVETIGEGAFKDADSLKSVTVGYNVETIGKDAFSGCESLETVKLGSSVATIGAGAFSGCSSLKQVSVPAATTTIGKNAFKGCEKLATVKIGKSVETIGAGAFSGCKSLKSVTAPASTTSIGKGAFKGCTKLSSARIGKNVKTVSASAFAGAKKLKTLTVSTTKLTKASCKNMLKGSSVKTIKLTGMSKSAKKKTIAKYQKWFPNKVAGKKLVIK